MRLDVDCENSDEGKSYLGKEFFALSKKKGNSIIRSKLANKWLITGECLW